MNITAQAHHSLRRKANSLPTWRARLARKLVLRGLSGIRNGSLVVREADRQWICGTEDRDQLTAEVRILDPRFWDAVLRGGSLGAGEAYVAGWWDSPDLAMVIRLLVRNRAALEGIDSGVARLAKPFLRWIHRANRNTRRGSQRNIAAHYDTSNDFFAAWLDPTMNYSCAIWETGEESLEEAQRNKMELLCRRLKLRPGME
ncbi:MAG: class I SAM-dependent methyltransferase, partial [Planctomycetes bacterium]|nr:class I SAM-dependent methyltransferase [Planctomycetota bacterium]